MKVRTRLASNMHFGQSVLHLCALLQCEIRTTKQADRGSHVARSHFDIC